ncbi:hypothetical protein PMZ80_009316 [Knufia obscura]|uniref:Uncharacterized protein n=2 Tax=Knufia TaxID=430999 RepID=A0AAN8IQ96_9EURO|nr:hypothetical protein PMZ80_009316 [Knufia obscura]KAK5955777.1 hypothetical protein OHC33_003418 [Knufia fluminis]
MSAETNTTAPVTTDPALPPTDSTTSSSTKSSTSNLPITPEMPGSEKGGSGPKRQIDIPRVPTDLKSLLNTTDTTLTRLNKLLKTPGGLASFLSTTNYLLYILAHLHLTAPTRAQLLIKLNSYLGRSIPKIAPGAVSPTTPSTPLLPLALTLGDLRTTLRLTGLIPLYVLLKSLIKSNEPDTLSYTIKLAQCASYITFQALENISHLTNKTVINANWTNARFSRLGGTTKMMTWSCRAWLCGITCDFLRLFREAQLARQNGTYERMNEEEKRNVDKKWWSEFFVATSWYPMAIHYSVEGGVGLNLGMVGACGFLANLGNFLKAWEGTK